MTKQEMKNLSEKVAEHFVQKGYTPETFKDVNKDQVAKVFPEVTPLLEVSEKAYENFNEEETFNYFKTLVTFDIVYKLRKAASNWVDINLGGILDNYRKLNE